MKNNIRNTIFTGAAIALLVFACNKKQENSNATSETKASVLVDETLLPVSYTHLRAHETN
jgi:hypothetical protein